MNADFTRDFSHQLRFWALHVPLNALPSFIIAVSLFRLDKHPSAIFSILGVIALFIMGLATLTAVMPDLNRSGHPLARGLRAAMILRAWVSGLSVGMLLIAPSGLAIIPDFWCGLMANAVVKQIHVLATNPLPLPTGSFLPVMLTTVVEGLIIAIGIAMIAFFLCLYFQSRDRRKAFTSGGSPAPLR
jgi:hypothetical protein